MARLQCSFQDMRCYSSAEGENPFNPYFKICEPLSVGQLEAKITRNCQVGEVAMLIDRGFENQLPPGLTIRDIPEARSTDKAAKYTCVDERTYFNIPAAKDICNRKLPPCDDIPPGPAMCAGPFGVEEIPETCSKGMTGIWEFQDWRSPSKNYNEKQLKFCAMEEDVDCGAGKRAMHIPVDLLKGRNLRELGIAEEDLGEFAYEWPSIRREIREVFACVSDEKYESARPYQAGCVS
jgi:hypothetical protein